MAEYCTCGAQLPEDALFCHKCGKPQREIIAPEIEANTYQATPAAVTLAEVPPPPRLQALPLNFHNPIAVRIALVAAVSATIFNFLLVVNWLAAGFLAAFFYRRKTGLGLNVAAGVKIGWMTGVITYVFSTIIFTAQQLPDALSGHMFKTVLDQMKSAPFQDPTVVKMFETDPGMATVLLLIVLFVFVTCLSMAGGALGAKLVGSPK
jgi:hypothetical protein